MDETRHIHYVFMQFPAPSEAFARVELRGLMDAGCRVSVSTLRAPPRDAADLLREENLERLPVSYAGMWKSAKGLWDMSRHPGRASRVLWEVLSTPGDGFKATLVALVLLPRAFGIALELRTSDADHVHLFWGHYPSLVGLALERLDGERPVSMFLGAYDLVRRSALSRKLAQRVQVMTHAGANIPAIASFAGIDPGRVALIYRGISIPEAPAPCPSCPPRIVVAERLVPEKHTVDALNVFARIAGAFPEASLSVLGDGPQLGRLKHRAGELELEDSVAFSGRVPHEKVLEEMATAHVVVSMSRSGGERLPNAIKEAMACCCGVVVTRTPGIEELVDEGVTGHIVEAGDIDLAASRTIELLSNPDRLKSFGERARQKVVEEFDIAHTTRRRLSCWFPGVNDREPRN